MDVATLMAAYTAGPYTQIIAFERHLVEFVRLVLTQTF